MSIQEEIKKRRTFAIISHPVSYTHLDVYKRQHLISSYIWAQSFGIVPSRPHQFDDLLFFRSFLCFSLPLDKEFKNHHPVP